MGKLLYPELSYKIIGALYKVHNELGSGYQEKYYCRAIALELKRLNLTCKEQVHFNIQFNGESIGKYFADFVIENKIILEMKIGFKVIPRDKKQLLGYLKQSGLEIGILAYFGKDKVLTERMTRGYK